LAGRYIVKEADARRESLPEPFLLSVADQGIDVVGIAEPLFLDFPQTLEEPCVRVLDPGHELNNFLANAGAHVLDEALVVCGDFLIEGILAGDFVQLVHHALGVYVEEIEILIYRKA
jgi:hypothetical protein